MNKIIFSILFLLSIVTQVFTQNSELYKALDILDRRVEVYIKFEINNPLELQTLTRIISIDNVKGNEVYAYANKKEFDVFLDLNYSYQVLTPPSELILNPEMYNPSKGIWDFDTYPTYDQYLTMMTTFATNYPNICRLVNVGSTVEGRQLIFAVISDNVNTREAEPRFSYSSSMHGDEVTCYVNMLRLIDYLLDNYGSVSQVTTLVNGMEIWICPLENPDGTYAGGNASVSGATRYNGNGVDLNRNYPDLLGSSHPDGEAWQPETIRMMALADSLHFVASGNFHGGAEVVNYPWDTKAALHADDNWYQFVSNEFADQAQANGPAGYFTSVSSTGITNGYAWYEVDGSRQDWMNYFGRSREICFEVSDTKMPAASTMPIYWAALYPSLLDFMQQASYGIRGIITDGCSGNPMVANVTIQGHDLDNSDVYSELTLGDYYRPIKAGNYTIVVSASGYQTQTFTNISVSDYSVTTLNVTLTPAAPVADFSASATTSCNGTIDFTCLTGGVDTWSWNFGDSQTSNIENPTHSYSTNGNYTVTLTVTNCSGVNSDTEIKTNYITINAPVVPAVTDASHCGPGSVLLSATGTGDLDWYDAISGGSFIQTGTSYTTPSLSATTTYYVENHVVSIGSSQYGGKVDNSGTGGNHISAGYGLYFDVLQDMRLVSVKVYSSQLGNRTIQILDGSSNVVFNQSISIPNGESRVTINADLTPGTDYSILCTTTPNLYRDGGATAPDLPYPYTVPGVFSITGNPANDIAYYYYFYDWEVQTISDCSSARTPVTATIETQANVGVSISSTDTTICLGSNVIFTATGTNGGTTPNYQWFIGGVSVQNGASNTYSSTAFTEGDVVTCTMTSSLSCNDGPITSSPITMHASAPVSIGISIAASETSICAGESVVFTATAINGGTSPNYKWYVNGFVVQNGSNNTYTTSSISDGDVVSCQLTSSEPCNDGPVLSSTITMVVTVGTPVSVNISTSTTSICSGELVTFTASPTNGGSSPIYNWFVNSVSVQSGSSNSFSTTSLTDGCIVDCQLTSSVTCALGSPASSNQITISVNSTLPVSVNILGDTDFCSGDNVLLTASSSNGGTSPTYLWYLNGALVQSGPTETYSSSLFVDGDEVYCVITSSLSCASGNPATSPIVYMYESLSLPVSVLIAGDLTICTGETITYTATPSNGGSSPNYEWFLNSISVQNGTSNTYTSSTLNDGDIISCVLSSSISCSSGNPASSNLLTISAQSNLPVSLNITGNTSICSGANVTLTANPTNAGSSPNYQWFVGGTSVQNGSSDTYSSSTLVDGNAITCILTSSEICASNNPATSNTLYIDVQPIPTADFTNSANNNVITFTNTSDNATSYMWYFGDNNSTNMPNPVHTYNNSGTYDVMLIATNSCGSDTVIYSINVIIIDIESIDQELNVTLFPNPTNGILYIKIEGNVGHGEIIITDALGKILFDTKAGQEAILTFDMSGMAKGIYVLQLFIDDQVITKRIMIE
ncbi:MAG: M14 family zinc carboxypeptidase [Bacteroidota bacterium]